MLKVVSSSLVSCSYDPLVALIFSPLILVEEFVERDAVHKALMSLPRQIVTLVVSEPG